MSLGSDQMREIERTLSSEVGRFQKKHGGEMPRGALMRTPADELMAKEEAEGIVEPSSLPLFSRANGAGGVAENGNGTSTPFDEMDEFERQAAAESREAVLMKLEAFFWVLDFLFADGPHPGKVMRRLYALVKKYRPEAIWDMGYRNLGKLFGETGAAMEWRVGAMIDDYARSHGLSAVKMPWQRTAEACGAYSDSQKENSSRGGGTKSAKHKARARDASAAANPNLD